jgi:hypothetical protein
VQPGSCSTSILVRRTAIMVPMLGLYIVTAIIGGGLMLLSALSGLGAHLDVAQHLGFGEHSIGDHDAGGHDHGGGDTDSPALWIPFLSIRFWTYAIGTFGVIGVLLTWLTRSHEPLVAGISGAMGLLMGLVAAGAFRLAQKYQSSSAVGTGDYVGSEAHVLVAVRPGHPGKVRMSIRGDLIDMIAMGEGDSSIEAGEQVFVTGLEGNQVRVARQAGYLDQP